MVNSTEYDSQYRAKAFQKLVWCLYIKTVVIMRFMPILLVKRQCLDAYVNKMGFRAIERHHGVNHTTVIRWVKQVGQQLPQALPHRDSTRRGSTR